MARQISADKASVSILGNIQEILMHQTELLQQISDDMIKSKKNNKSEKSGGLFKGDGSFITLQKIESAIVTGFSSANALLSKIVENTTKSEGAGFQMVRFSISKSSAKAMSIALEGMSSFIKSVNSADVKKIKEVSDSILGVVDSFSKGGASLKEFGKAMVSFAFDILKFAGLMVLATPLLILAIPGMMITKLIIETVIGFLKPLDNRTLKKIKDSTLSLTESAKNLLIFGSLLAIATPIMLLALPGVLATWLVVKIFTTIFSTLLTDKSIKEMNKGTSALKKMAFDLVIFGLVMTAMVLLIVPAVVGVLLTALLIGVITFVLTAIPEKEMNQGSRALMLATVAMIVLAGGIFIVGSLVDVKSILVTALMLVGVGLVFALLGVVSKYIKEGALAMLFASLPILALTGAMFLWKIADIGMSDIGSLLALVAGVGVEMALAGIVALPILLGAVALGVSAIAIILMTFSLKYFKTLKWSENDSKILKGTISGVLSALVGNGADSVGNFAEAGVKTLLALMGSAALIFASVAIFFMSFALKEFKSVNWTDADNKILSGTIEGVLNALGNPNGEKGGAGQDLLQSLLALVGAGALFLGAIAIWFFSFALKEFLSVGWTDGDNALLGGTISGVLNALGNPTGQSGNSSGDALTIILALMGAGALFMASAAIYLFGLSLSNFKKVGWTEEDNALLGNTIDGIFKVLGGSGEVGDAGGGILQTILALMKAGTIFVIAGAVWLLSEGLSKFKEVKWSSADNATLSSTINGIAEEFSKLDEIDYDDDVTDFLKDIGEALESFGEGLKEFKDSGWTVGDSFILSTSLQKAFEGFNYFSEYDDNNTEFISDIGEAIEDYADGLEDFKDIGWTHEDTDILTMSIRKLIDVFSGETFTAKKINLFGVFTNYIKDLSKFSTEVEKMAKSFESISKSLLSIKDSVNTTDLEKLTKYNEMLTSLTVAMEKSSQSTVGDIVTGVGSAIGGALDKFGSAIANKPTEAAPVNNVVQAKSGEDKDKPLTLEQMRVLVNELKAAVGEITSALHGTLDIKGTVVTSPN